MLTTPALIESLVASEGFRSLAYDDKQPWLELAPGEEDEVKGKITYGHGLTTRADGSPVQLGDTITEGESLDRVARHVREEIEPTLENLIHHELPSFQYDAIAHAMYQYGAEEVSGWRLIRRINAREDWEKIALEWINGTVMWMGEPMFWSRRIKEVLMFFGLDWRAAENVPADSDILEVIEDMGFDGEMPVAGPVHTPTRTEYSYDEDLFNELEIKNSGEVITDSTPDTPWTTEDLNIAQAESLRTGKPIDYGVPMTKLTKKTPVEAVHYLADEDKKPGNITVKPIEDSQRGKGYAKSEMGKQGMIAGAGGSAAVAIGAAEPVVRFVDKYPSNTIAIVFAGLLLFGLGLHFYGKWQRERGEDRAEDLLG